MNLVYTERGWLPVQDVTLEELKDFRLKVGNNSTYYREAVDTLIHAVEEQVDRLEALLP